MAPCLGRFVTQRAPWLLLLALVWHLAAPFAAIAEVAPPQATSIAAAPDAGAQGEWLPRAPSAEELGRGSMYDAGHRLRARAYALPAVSATRRASLPAGREHVCRWQGHPPRFCPATGWRCPDADDPS